MGYFLYVLYSKYPVTPRSLAYHICQRACKHKYKTVIGLPRTTYFHQVFKKISNEMHGKVFLFFCWFFVSTRSKTLVGTFYKIKLIYTFKIVFVHSFVCIDKKKVHTIFLFLSLECELMSSIKQVVLFGEGAGANILARFAVSNSAWGESSFSPFSHKQVSELWHFCESNNMSN